ncbi:DUF58 domain-containing protein [Halocatena halophila]|uniref:DUF58 domain-containing protein n=1 Tax=Halocatena halophila TaxID=2814576 RepID=UPI002ED35392
MASAGVVQRTNRWYGIAGVSLCCIGAGVLASAPVLVLAGVVAVGFAFADRIDSEPNHAIEISRSLATDTPTAGEELTVTLQITNRSDSICYDCRTIDGVPPALTVSDGSPRLGRPLAPGGTVTTEYTITAERGVHEFDDCWVSIGNATGTLVRQLRVPATGQSSVSCVPTAPQPVECALYGQAVGSTGRIATQTGGSGTEFHAVREYRRGDPPSRIDWNRAARTGELSTIEYVRERAATVVVVVDARAPAYCNADPHGQPAIERAIDGAYAITEGLLRTTNRVGVSALSPTDCWLEPSTGDDHRSQLRKLFGTHPALSPTAPTEPYLPLTMLKQLRHRLPSDAQVVLCTPLADSYPALAGRRLTAHGYPTTIVSPDPTLSIDDGTDDPRVAIAALERAERVRSLRNDGIRCIDWRNEPIQVSVERAIRRWSR